MATMNQPVVTCIRTLRSTTKAFSTPMRVPAAFSTSVRPARPTPRCINAQRTSLPSTLITKSRCTPTGLGVRHASATPSQSASSTAASEGTLTWDRFFALRKRRRWINLGCSFVTAIAAVGIVTPVLADQDLDSWGAQISGLDPIIVLGVSTFAVAAGGWLCGPSFGTAMFSLWAARRGWNKLIAKKEKSFFARIKRYRADPSASSPQNPIPDYYGEKIASVKDYRRWLKDQKAFNLKKNKNML